MPTLFRDDPADAPSSRERSRARALRQRMTEPEKRLWRHLRQRLPVERTHFRRQVPIEGYVADFCCLKARLVIEVDGNQHGFDANAQRDAARTEALKSRGYRMLRFSNREVMTAIDIVLDTILAALGPSPPTPGPSPQGGGASRAAASRDG
ncbi:MAG: endonuclease domain-containing protein [Microvirga sp.]